MPFLELSAKPLPSKSGFTALPASKPCSGTTTGQKKVVRATVCQVRQNKNEVQNSILLSQVTTGAGSNERAWYSRWESRQDGYHQVLAADRDLCRVHLSILGLRSVLCQDRTGHEKSEGCTKATAATQNLKWLKIQVGQTPYSGLQQRHGAGISTGLVLSERSLLVLCYGGVMVVLSPASFLMALWSSRTASGNGTASENMALHK